MSGPWRPSDAPTGPAVCLPAPSAADEELDVLDVPEAERPTAEEPVGLDADEEDEALENDANDRDDAHAHDLDIGDVDVAEEGGGTSDEAGFQVDHGDAALFDDHRDRNPDDDGATEEIEFDGLGEALPPTADDGGVEGTHDGTETTLGEALPALDAGGDEEIDLAELLRDVGLGEDSWEIASEHTVEAKLAAICCADGRVAAAGDVLAVLEPGEVTARVHALAQPARACVAGPAGVAITSSAGLGLRAGAADAELFQRPDIRRAAVAGGRIYALVDGELYRLDSTGGRATVVRRNVVDFAASAGTLIAIEANEHDGTLSRMRGHDGGWEDLGPAGTLGALALRGGSLRVNGALAMAGVEPGGVAVRRPARTTTRHFAIDSTVDAAFQGDGEDAPLLVLATTAAGSKLFSVGSTEPIELATLPGEPAVAIVWDASRERLFVAGPGGLVALRPRVRH